MRRLVVFCPVERNVITRRFFCFFFFFFFFFAAEPSTCSSFIVAGKSINEEDNGGLNFVFFSIFLFLNFTLQKVSYTVYRTLFFLRDTVLKVEGMLLSR
jgi:hypothetical protein